MMDIYRSYPQKINYQNSLQELLNKVNLLQEDHGKSAGIWIIGEFAEQIQPVFFDFIKNCVNNIQSRQVQLQLITTSVKLFLKYPDDYETIINELLETTTEQNINPDIRDRAYIYWRLLSSDPNMTKDLIFFKKPKLIIDDLSVDNEFLNIMLKNLGCLSSIYYRRPEHLGSRNIDLNAFIKVKKGSKEEIQVGKHISYQNQSQQKKKNNLLEFDIEENQQEKQIDSFNILEIQPNNQNESQEQKKEEVDLLDML